MPSCLVSGGRAQQRRSRSDNLIAVSKAGSNDDCFATQSSRGDLAAVIFSGRGLDVDVAGGSIVNDGGCGQHKLRRRGARNGEAGEHFRLIAMFWVGQDHAHLESATGGVHGIRDIGNFPRTVSPGYAGKVTSTAWA